VLLPLDIILGSRRPPDACFVKARIPWRGIVYVLASVPCFFTLLSALGGVFALVTAAFDIVAAIRQEQGSVRICCNRKASLPRWGGQPVDDRDEDEIADDNCGKQLCRAIKDYLDDMRRGNMIGATVVLVLYTLINVTLFAQRAYETNIKVQCSQEATTTPSAECAPLTWYNEAGDKIVLSNWFTIAKCFGQLLNFNCAMLLLPIARSFLLFLSNKIVASRQTCAANIPMQHNVKFHKIIARVTVFCAAGHMGAHLISVADFPAVYEALGLPPWITGTTIVLSMLSIYGGGSDVRIADSSVKRCDALV